MSSGGRGIQADLVGNCCVLNCLVSRKHENIDSEIYISLYELYVNNNVHHGLNDSTKLREDPDFNTIGYLAFNCLKSNSYYIYIGVQKEE